MTHAIWKVCISNGQQAFYYHVSAASREEAIAQITESPFRAGAEEVARCPSRDGLEEARARMGDVIQVGALVGYSLKPGTRSLSEGAVLFNGTDEYDPGMIPVLTRTGKARLVPVGLISFAGGSDPRVRSYQPISERHSP